KTWRKDKVEINGCVFSHIIVSRYLDNRINDLKNDKSWQCLFGYFSKISRAPKSFGKVTRNKNKTSHMKQIYSRIQGVKHNILFIKRLNHMTENNKHNQYKSSIIKIRFTFSRQLITPIAFSFFKVSYLKLICFALYYLYINKSNHN